MSVLSFLYSKSSYPDPGKIFPVCNLLQFFLQSNHVGLKALSIYAHITDPFMIYLDIVNCVHAYLSPLLDYTFSKAKDCTFFIFNFISL